MEKDRDYTGEEMLGLVLETLKRVTLGSVSSVGNGEGKAEPRADDCQGNSKVEIREGGHGEGESDGVSAAEDKIVGVDRAGEAVQNSEKGQGREEVDEEGSGEVEGEDDAGEPGGSADDAGASSEVGEEVVCDGPSDERPEDLGTAATPVKEKNRKKKKQ